MTRRVPLVAFALAALSTGACGGFQTAIPVTGPDSDRASLVGHWEGEFVGAVGRRTGIVDFDLTEPADTAFGVVVLIPHDPRPPEVVRDDPRPMSQPLEIEFIEIDDGMVRGALRLYRDPFDDGRIRTTFQGRLEGDSVSGTYEAVSLDTGALVSGRWEMHRREHR